MEKSAVNPSLKDARCAKSHDSAALSACRVLGLITSSIAICGKTSVSENSYNKKPQKTALSSRLVEKTLTRDRLITVLGFIFITNIAVKYIYICKKLKVYLL